jgi:DDE superfamily endonuclease
MPLSFLPALLSTCLERMDGCLHARSRVRVSLLCFGILLAGGRRTVTSWVAAPNDRIEWFYLPRRAPELNADEYLNNDLKGQINAQGLPDSKEELRSRIQRFMRGLLNLPAHVKSYFRHPCVQYAAGP